MAPGGGKGCASPGLSGRPGLKKSDTPYELTEKLKSTKEGSETLKSNY